MVNGQPGELQEISGASRQWSPEQAQVVDGESQVSTLPPATIIELAEPDKRIPPSATGQYPGEATEVITEEAGGVPVAEGAPEAAPVKIAFPALRWTRYAGTDQNFVELVSWTIPIGYTGDLHEISLQSDNDAKTRWRITIAGVNQAVPTDRTLATPITWPWRDTILPGPTQVMIEVMSTDGTSITVDASITGTLRVG